jgi:fibronectin-binding autotransporter adhesin
MAAITSLQIYSGGEVNGEFSINGNILFSGNGNTINDNFTMLGSSTFSGDEGIINGLATIETGTLTVNSSLSLTGNGSLVVQDGATLVNNGTVDLSFIAQGNLDGGSGSLFTNSVILETATVAGDLDLDDTLTVRTMGASSLTDGSIVDVLGTTDVLEGSLVIDEGAVLLGNGNVITAGGAELRVNGDVEKDVIVEIDGIVGGDGFIDGNLDIFGILDPGNSAGTIQIAGDVVLTSTSTTDIEVGGREPGTEHDEIKGVEMNQMMFLDGELKISLINEVFAIG